jgi:hypothetical protein
LVGVPVELVGIALHCVAPTGGRTSLYISYASGQGSGCARHAGGACTASLA